LLSPATTTTAVAQQQLGETPTLQGHTFHQRVNEILATALIIIVAVIPQQTFSLASSTTATGVTLAFPATIAVVLVPTTTAVQHQQQAAATLIPLCQVRTVVLLIVLLLLPQ